MLFVRVDRLQNPKVLRAESVESRLRKSRNFGNIFVLLLMEGVKYSVEYVARLLIVVVDCLPKNDA